MACNDKLIYALGLGYACLRRQTRHKVLRHVNVAERTRKTPEGITGCKPPTTRLATTNATNAHEICMSAMTNTEGR